MLHRRHQLAGFATFSLLELVLVIVLVVVLVITALENLLPLRGQAESARFAQTLGALRGALGLTISERVLAGGLPAVAGLAQENPMTWLAVTPGNYTGASDHLDPAGLPPGGWGFDNTTRSLVYRVQYPEYFQGGDPGPPHIRLTVRLDYADRNGNRRFDPADNLRGVALVASADYAWVVPEDSETLRLLGLGQ